ncbi:MAG: ABC transporter ATP-binding protein [Peptococcaceae bacterium]
MLKILKHLGIKEWTLIFVSLLFIVVQVWLDLRLPDYMSEITLLVQTPGSTMGEIWQAGGYMLLCALGSLVASVIVGFFAARVAASFSKKLRALLFDKVESFSMQEINQFSTASLITRSTNDITQVQMIVAMGLQVIIKAPILAVWAVVKISGKSWQWTASTAGAVAFLLVLVTVIVLFALPKFKKVQVLTDNLNKVTRENLTGLRVVRAYNAEEYEEAKFAKANHELTATNLFTSRIMAIMQPGMGLIMSGLNLAVYWIGAYLINAAGIRDKMVLFSDMVVFSAYAMQVVMAFMMLTIIFILLPRAAVAANRINEVLETQQGIVDGTVSASSSALKGEIEFRKVSFRYPGAPEYVLKDVSFTARQGETVAFIGSTGSGKSTLINLIPRFYDATEGEVLVDGVNVKDYQQRVLYNKLGYVPQGAVLFSGSVSSNVAYGDNGQDQATLQDVKKALEIAQGQEFVEKMDGQYEAAISQGGANISGGQKQRIAISRAICRKPEIYIFDDSFSALDYKTDRRLRAVLKKETAHITSLIVAQRVGTIIDADKIIVLDEGRVVGVGTHQELLKNCAVYQEIAYSQLSEEELAG